MGLLNNREYYKGRVEASRQLADRAENPQIARIHSEFATRYERTLLGMDAEIGSSMRSASSDSGSDDAREP